MGRGKEWTIGESKVSSSGGRPPKLDAAKQQHLRSLALQHPNATVDDLRERVRQQLDGQKLLALIHLAQPIQEALQAGQPPDPAPSGPATP